MGQTRDDESEEWFDRGNELFELGRYKEAIVSYDQAIEIKPDYREAWYNQGVALVNSGRYEEAITSFDRAIEINPDNYKYWSSRGIALGKLGRYEEAIASYDQAIRINPDYPEVWHSRGIALRDLGRYPEVIDSVDRAIEIKPDYHDAWSNRGFALVNLGKYPEAIAGYDRAIEINPDDHAYWVNRGIAVGLYKESYLAEIEAYRKAFQHIRPNTHPEGWGYLQREIGRTYYKEGNNQLLNYRRSPQDDYDLALTHYHNALTTLTREQFPQLRLETLIDTAKLKNVTKSFDLLTNPEIESAIIAHLFQPKTIIPTGSVNKKDLCTAFNTPHTYGHFNGHAYHDPRRPQDSSLIIDGDELTCQDLAHIDLTPYHLITLSACQTGVTTHQSIDTEYVGLVSAFLSRGTNYVVSTLWSVKDLPSSLLMMAFYLYFKNNPAPLALYKAADWLKNLTHAEEAKFHQNVYQRLPQNTPAEQTAARTTDRNRRIAAALAQEQPEATPYSSPYYWAAFTISGWG